MDRKGIAAVSLAVVTLLGWYYWNNQEMQKLAAQRASRQAIAAEIAAKTKPPEPVQKPEIEAAPVAPADPTPVSNEKTESLSSDSVDYTFSNLGGGVAKALLKKHNAERGKNMILNEFGTVPIGAILEAPGEHTRAVFESRVEAGAITFARTDARQVQLTKKFTLPKSTALEKDYIVELDVTFSNRGAQPVAMPAYFVHTGSASPVHARDLPSYTGFKWMGGKLIDASAFEGGMIHKAPVFPEQHEGVAWAAVVNQYFTTIISPATTAQDPAAQAQQRGSSVWAQRFAISDELWKSGHESNGSAGVRYAVEGALGMPAFTLEPGKSMTQSFRIYAGPREYGRLRLLANGESDVMNFGIFAPVSKVLLNSMNWLNSKLGSYALAIITLTLTIKCLLWPLQNKATQSMKRMQLLGPKQTEIREKYKDDPTRMNTEVMKLYKDYGVNPVGGCLPMLVQIPVFFGFYSMLGTAVELRNAKGGIFFWVHDLSLPDTVWHLPGAGWPLNVLPLCMAGTMLWQMAISPKSGDPTQQKMMMFMPLIFIAFCYNFASALALYWTVQNLFSVAQLYATRNQAPPTLVKALPRKK